MSQKQTGWQIFSLIIGLTVFFSLLGAGTVCAAGPMLPQTYSDQDIRGWLMSEKLDGVRGYWNGKHLRSRNGNLLYPPSAFTAKLPDFALEGELWGGRGTFEQTLSIVTKEQAHEGWLQLKFAIFDVPRARGGFSTRIAKADAWFGAQPSAHAFVIPQVLLRDQSQLHQELARIEELGGEGLIVRKADALYRAGRSSEILKVKNYSDAEARVVAHLPGKGRNAGRLGSLLVSLDGGTQFKIGSGFSDAERQSPPPIGTYITFKYYGYYQSGIPKFPSFMRSRQDRKP